MDRLNTIMRLVLLLTLCFGATTFSSQRGIISFMRGISQRLQGVPSMRTLQSNQVMWQPPRRYFSHRVPGQQASLVGPTGEFRPHLARSPLVQFLGQSFDDLSVIEASTPQEEKQPLEKKKRIKVKKKKSEASEGDAILYEPTGGFQIGSPLVQGLGQSVGDQSVIEKEVPLSQEEVRSWMDIKEQRLVDLIPQEQLDRVVEFNDQVLRLYREMKTKNAVGSRLIGHYDYVLKKMQFGHYNTILLYKDNYSSQQVTEALMQSLEWSLYNGLGGINYYLKEYHDGVVSQLSQLFTDIDGLQNSSRKTPPFWLLFSRWKDPKTPLEEAIKAVKYGQYLNEGQRESLKGKIINTLYMQSENNEEEPLLFKLMGGYGQNSVYLETYLLEKKFKNVRKDFYDDQEKKTEEIASELDAIITQLPEILTDTFEVCRKTQDRFAVVTGLLSQAGYSPNYSEKTSDAFWELRKKLEKLRLDIVLTIQKKHPKRIEYNEDWHKLHEFFLTR
ncbi:MAG: hypothetical protein WBQ73_01015 [Candidatus Babeliales bacterium]